MMHRLSKQRHPLRVENDSRAGEMVHGTGFGHRLPSAAARPSHSPPASETAASISTRLRDIPCLNFVGLDGTAQPGTGGPMRQGFGSRRRKPPRPRELLNRSDQPAGQGNRPLVA